MPKKTQTKGRTQMKALPKPEKKLTKEEAKQVKGGQKGGTALSYNIEPAWPRK